MRSDLRTDLQCGVKFSPTTPPATVSWEQLDWEGFCVGLWVVLYTTVPRSRPWTRADVHDRIKAVSRLLRAHGVQMFWMERDEERASREEANVNLSFKLSLDHLLFIVLVKHSRKLLIMRSMWEQRVRSHWMETLCHILDCCSDVQTFKRQRCWRWMRRMLRLSNEELSSTNRVRAELMRSCLGGDRRGGRRSGEKRASGTRDSLRLCCLTTPDVGDRGSKSGRECPKQCLQLPVQLPVRSTVPSLLTTSPHLYFLFFKWFCFVSPSAVTVRRILLSACPGADRTASLWSPLSWLEKSERGHQKISYWTNTLEHRAITMHNLIRK